MASFFDEILAGLRGGWEISQGEAKRLLSRSHMRNGFRNPFVTEKERERLETRKLYDEVHHLYLASRYADPADEYTFYYSLVTDACNESNLTPPVVLGEALYRLVQSLVVSEGSLYGWPEINWSAELTMEEGVWLRNYLGQKKRFLRDHKRLHEIWRDKVRLILVGILSYLPEASIAVDDAESEEETPGSIFVPLIALADNPGELIERLAITTLDDDITLAQLFDPIRERFEYNVYAASGIPYEQRNSTSKQIVWPTESKPGSPSELVTLYLSGTPFAEFFNTPLPFHIPLPVRFEHTHIVGGTGHGKTQLMQLLLSADLSAAVTEQRSLIVMDSQGDLIHTISHLPCFKPDANGSLSDRLLIIDPNDIEYPVCLNMFDCHQDALDNLRPVDREKILNGTVDLYEYLFGAVLGAELTARQGMIFKYLARLMMQIPGATIHTFREIMEDGEKFRPYMEQLPPTASAFFKTQFFNRNFNGTKTQILNRLWGVLSNSTFDRMFSHKQNKVDLFDAMQSGKIVLINTAKELLKQDGCSIFGRFFIALIAQAALRRTVLAPHERHPAFVYIDEAHDYFDDNIDQLLIQARKYRIGMVLAHQSLDQLSTSLRASLMTNTSTKFVGGVSAKDANTFAGEMRTNADFVLGMRKSKTDTNFACYVRNLTPQAIAVGVPLGHLEQLPPLSDAEHERNIEVIRERYAAPPDDSWEPAEEEAPTQAAVATPKASTVPASRPGPDIEMEAGLANRSSVDSAPESSPAATDATTENSVDLGEPVPSLPTVPPITKATPVHSPGRGGKQHKYLQKIIQQAAEECGYRASIEEPILDGAGWVDVSLEKGRTKIACEISMTTTRDHELGNIEKCLAAGYQQVFLVAPNERRRNSLQKFITGQLEDEQSNCVQFVLPDEFITQLYDLTEPPAPTEQNIRGYRVKATQKKLSDEETKARREAIGKVIARSMGKPA